MSSTAGLRGWSILVVEDEYMIADDMRVELEMAGAEVLGPVATVATAFDVLRRAKDPDLAILDINLQGEMVYPLASYLQDRKVPIVFATGYGGDAVPREFSDVRRLQKPIGAGLIARLVADAGRPRPR